MVANFSRGREIGGWFINFPGVDEDFEDFPEFFDPRIVKEFYHEVAIVAMEEWLHILQKMTDSPLAGQVDKEADITEYLDNQGIYLSADFLTRYAARFRWCVHKHPERIEELRQFAQKYGRVV